jgi:hypothetical protein
MEVKDGLIDLAESIIYFEVEGVDSFQDVVDLFLIVIFPEGEDLCELLDIGHFQFWSLGPKLLFNYKS